MTMIVEAGPTDEQFRSDCWVSVELTEAGGVELKVLSKVEVMYGEAIRGQAREILEQLGVAQAKVVIKDAGALPFILGARLETAVKRAWPGCKGEYLPAFSGRCQGATRKDRLRRSRLYVPGSQPHLMINAGLYEADEVIFDLEDSVAPSEKDAARIMVRNALRCVDLAGAERLVRINPLPLGLEDIKAVAGHNVHVLMIPKCQSGEEIQQVDLAVGEVLKEQGIGQTVYYMPVIENALGVLRAYEIATASEKVVALSMGLEDYTADIGVERTKEGVESLWARGMVVNAAKAAGVGALDTVFSDVEDLEGLRESVLEAKGLGFEGKGCIHPRQIKVVHEGFAPTEKEIEKACTIVKAYEQAQAEGKGVVALGSKMIDVPVLRRAQKTVETAISLGLLKKEWPEEES